MNHKRRAENAVKRVLAEHLHQSDLCELLTMSVERALRQTERDARRITIARAANAVGAVFGAEGWKHPAFEAVITLERQR
jgi:hypothetical protein